MATVNVIGDWKAGLHWHEFTIVNGGRVQYLDLILGRRRRVLEAVKTLEGRNPAQWMVVRFGPVAAAVRLQG